MKTTPRAYSKFGLLYLVLLCLLALPASASLDLTTYEGVEKAYRAGQITKAEKLWRETDIFFSPPALSAGQAQPGPWLKSGTALVREVVDNWQIFSDEQKVQLSAMLARPSAPYSFDSPNGHFKIHYNTTGPELVPSEDLDGDLIPDYVERVAQYCDSAYHIYIVYYGYLPPPDDDGRGGDDKYDVYLLSLGGYGVTFPDAAGDSLWNDYSSYIGIHNNFYGFPLNDDPEGDTIGAQKVTCAHEFHHAVQLAYDRYEDLWWMEAAATWMEEVVFSEVNDNYNYLYLFFDVPERGLTSVEEYHMYGAFIWSAFLQEYFDDGLFRPTWEACRYNNSLAALDSGLAAYGTNFNSVFSSFVSWNYRTGSRALSGQYYQAAADYPDIKLDRTLMALAHDSLTPASRPEGLAANYAQYDVADARGILAVELRGLGAVKWSASVVAYDGSGDTLLSGTASVGQPVRLYLAHVQDYQRLTVIPGVLTAGTSDNLYYLSTYMYPYGDANGDRAVNVGDAYYLINHVFHDGDAPIPVEQTGDANCDGGVNIADAVWLINYVFNYGLAPCQMR